MLHEFLESNKNEILGMTEKKSLMLAGMRPSSDQLKKGLPIFFQQLLDVLELEEKSNDESDEDHQEMAQAASDNDEEAMALASSRPEEAGLAKTAGLHGEELMRLGYTLSHVVHAYGSMCQSITELATNTHETITADEFHDLNRCLDIAIAGAVTQFQHHTDFRESKREVEHLGFLAHELRNTLTSVNISLQMIKKGSVGFGGSTGAILDKSLKRMQNLIDDSLTEVRMRVDPKVHLESIDLRQLIDQMIVTSQTEADEKNQSLEMSVDPGLKVMADGQLLYSAISNLIQNALKYTKRNGRIQIRAGLKGKSVVIEVEDECGGLSDETIDLFKPFEQQNENKKGLGLGLTIAQKAINLNAGMISVKNLPGKGCIFNITLPLSPRLKL